MTVGETPLEMVAAPSFAAKVAIVGPSRPRMHDQLLHSSYVLPQEWVYPLVDTLDPGPKASREINDRWNPFNKREPSLAHMHDLYPTLLQGLVAARIEQYSIPFPIYMDRETFQLMVEDGMLIRNHNFHQSIELVRFDF